MGKCLITENITKIPLETCIWNWICLFLLDFKPKTWLLWLLKRDICPSDVCSLMHNSIDHIDFYTQSSQVIEKHNCQIALLETALSKSCAALNKGGLTIFCCVYMHLLARIRDLKENWCKRQFACMQIKLNITLFGSMFIFCPLWLWIDGLTCTLLYFSGVLYHNGQFTNARIQFQARCLFKFKFKFIDFCLHFMQIRVKISIWKCI